MDLAQQSGSVVSTPADATGATHSAADHIQQPAAGFGTAVAASSCGTSDRCSPDIEERVRQSTSVDAAQDSSAAVDSSIKGDASPADGSGELLQVPAIAAAMDGGESPACAVGGGNGSPLAASPWAQCMATSADTSTGRQNPPVVSSPNPLGQSVVQSAGHDGAQTAPNSNRADVPATTTTATTPETVDNSHACKLAAIPPAVSPPAAAVPANHAHSTGEEWEMVPADVPAAAVGARQLEAIDSIKALVQQLPSHGEHYAGQHDADDSCTALNARLHPVLIALSAHVRECCEQFRRCSCGSWGLVSRPRLVHGSCCSGLHSSWQSFLRICQCDEAANVVLQLTLTTHLKTHTGSATLCLWLLEAVVQLCSSSINSSCSSNQKQPPCTFAAGGCCMYADCVDAAQSAQQTVLQAMLEVPWIPGEGVPQEIDEHGEYARLLAAGGQLSRSKRSYTVN